MDRQVVLVTGAGRGIGRGIAQCFADEGAGIAVNDVDADQAQETVERLRQAGAETVAVPGDISVEPEVQSFVGQTLKAFGRIDCLVNNAGIQVVEGVEQLASEDWRRGLSVDLTGAFLCAKHVVPAMVKQGRGVIINIASIHARVSFGGYAAYDAAKSGLLGLTRSLAVDFGPKGIRAVVVSPGFIDKGEPMPYYQRMGEEVRRRDMAFHPVGRFGTPQDVGNLVVFLASDKAAFISGTEIVIDGGITARFGKMT